MKAVRVVGVVLFWAFCFVVAANVTARFGQEVGWLLVTGVTCSTVWAGHTPRSRWMVTRLMEIAELHMPAKAAAATVGVTQSRWSEWKSGEEQASLSRLAELPDYVWNDFFREVLEGQGFVVVASGRLASATSALLALEAAVRAQAADTVPRQGAA
jgi:hypothetical protein